MLIHEFINTRYDGVKLYRTCSDIDILVRKVGTEELYTEAIDIEDIRFAYTETDIPIDDTGELTVEDTLTMLRDLGVDISD